MSLLENRSGRVRGPQADTAAHWWQFRQRENFIDPLPTIDGCILTEEICPATNLRARSECVGGLQMGRGGVLDVDRVDSVFPISDSAQLSLAVTIDQTWNQMPITRAPNQMRPQAQVNRAPSSFAERTCCSAKALVCG